MVRRGSKITRARDCQKVRPGDPIRTQILSGFPFYKGENQGQEENSNDPICSAWDPVMCQDSDLYPYFLGSSSTQILFSFTGDTGV